MDVKIIKSKRKTVAIQVKNADEVVVRAPIRMSNKAIQDFIDKNQNWINKHVERLKTRQEVTRDIRPMSELEIKELTAHAKKVIPERVRHFAPLIGVDYGRVTIRNQKTKWGSCSEKGNLNFNLALMRAPIEVLDYVVVHELCHRKEMNHSPEFWKTVENVLPNYKEQKKWLDENGYILMTEVNGKN